MNALLLLLLLGPVELRNLDEHLVGVAYHVFWSTKEGETDHWDIVKKWKQPMPIDGPYDCEDREVIRRQIAQMRQCGINSIAFDDTNCVWVDNSRIDRRINAWFDYMDALPEKERIPLTIFAGGELNQHGNREGWVQAVNFLYNKYGKRPSYGYLDGKPLLFWYIEKHVWDDWNDDRWSIRRISHWFLEKQEFVGWDWSTPELVSQQEGTQLKPGWFRRDNPEGISREHGLYYMKSWKNALDGDPKFVLIGSWNEFAECTGIEPTTVWKDQYLKLTKGYTAALRRQPLEGYSYFWDGKKSYFKWDKGKWKRTNSHGRDNTILLPEGWFLERP